MSPLTTSGGWSGAPHRGEGESPVASGPTQDQEQAKPRRELRPPPCFDLQVDEGLDLDVKVQEELLEFAAGLGRPYHEILGVQVDADGRTLKKAYFQKSKRFHPDRYFRKNVGEFAPLIETCFKKLLEAYELLSDPATRKEVQRELHSSQPTPAPTGTARKAEASDAQGPATQARPRLTRAQAARRLRRRVSGLAGHKKHRQERKQKAKTFFEAGMAAFRDERWTEAAGSVRLAIAFDPANEIYHDEFAKVQRRAHEERAKLLIKQGESALDLRDGATAYEAFSEAFHYRPFDADLAFRAAKLAWQVAGDLRRAKELAQSACELEPERGDFHRVLGQIYKAAGLRANARRELEAAIRLDSKDKEARVELRGL